MNVLLLAALHQTQGFNEFLRSSWWHKLPPLKACRVCCAMWQALFGKKTPENEHSIQVRFAPGWNAAFIEQRSMQMPSKWTSDTEEWFNVSSMAWHGIIRTIEETLYCEETKAIQKKIRPEIDLVR